MSASARTVARLQRLFLADTCLMRSTPGPVVADRNRQLSGSPINIIVDLWQAVH
jgi:hypothetical protein